MEVLRYDWYLHIWYRAWVLELLNNAAVLDKNIFDPVTVLENFEVNTEGEKRVSMQKDYRQWDTQAQSVSWLLFFGNVDHYLKSQEAQLISNYSAGSALAFNWNRISWTLFEKRLWAKKK